MPKNRPPDDDFTDPNPVLIYSPSVQFMGRDLEEMPLFPLNAVLLPYQAIPLHVFEDRYRRMIRRCIAEDRSFGVVLIRQGDETGDPDVTPYMVGTSARILEHSTLPDGKLHLTAVGERRFRIRRIERDDGHLVGLVEPIIELEWTDTPEHDTLISRAKDAFRLHISALFGGKDVNLKISYTDDPVALSFAIAGCIHLSTLEKQRILEITDTAERMREIVPLLEAQAVETMTTAQRTVEDDFEDFLFPN